MLFSKSFGYALRSILYLSTSGNTGKRIKLEEISKELSVPRYFLGKILNKLVQKDILYSTKGPFGGFSLNDKTMETSLLIILKTVDGIHPFASCVLKMKKCNASHPCILHLQIAPLRDQLHEMLKHTSVKDLSQPYTPPVLHSILLR